MLYALSIFYFSAQPESSAGSMTSSLLDWFPNLARSDVQALIFYIRKLGHVLAYGVAAGLIVFALRGMPRLRKQALPLGFVLTMILAGLDEWYQSILPHRTGAFTDVLIDMIGVIIAVVILKYVLLRRDYQEEQQEQEAAEHDN